MAFKTKIFHNFFRFLEKMEQKRRERYYKKNKATIDLIGKVTRNRSRSRSKRKG